MFKVALLIALAVAGINAQGLTPPQGEAAPEPYSYGYETDSHAAAEQKDPSGRVTGYYTLADADGRQRRVEYVADQDGFRAKVQTNEVGTKSENSADVETLAAPPTREQYNFEYPARVQSVAVAQQPQRVASQQVVSSAVSAVQPARSGAFSSQQYNGYYGPAYGSGYGAGYGYGLYGANYGANYAGYYPGYGAASSRYVYNSAASPAYGYTYGVANPAAAGYGYYGVGNYNNHLPSSYYRSVSTNGVVPSTYGASSGVVSGGYAAAPVATLGNYRTYQTVAAPAVARSSTGYSTVGASNLGGSSNYIVLQKRDSEAAAKESVAAEKPAQK